MKSTYLQTSQRKIDYTNKTLIMAILNVTPDSFSDGGQFNSVDKALNRVELLIEDGADIIDVGGESTRPNSKRVSVEDEIYRVVPIIEAIKKRFDIPISIDTSKQLVAEKSVEAGAEIINDVSGLRFDENLAEVSEKYSAGLILMHLRGEFTTMHKQTPVEDVFHEVTTGFNWSIEKAKEFGVGSEQICLDVGIGFSKTFEQNLKLIAKLNELCNEFINYPMLIGTSRKSFIGNILCDNSIDERIYGTIATSAISVWNGASIVRVHDVKEMSQTLKVLDELKMFQ